MEASLNIILDTGNTTIKALEAERLIKAMETEAKKQGITIKSYTYDRS
jgi:hypothetical protein